MQNVEQVSCTDVRQKWGRVKRNIQHPYNNSALPIQNYCHFSREDAIVDYSSVDEALSKSFLHKLLSCEPDGEAAIHLSKRRRTDYIINITPYNPDYLLHLSLVHSLLDKSDKHLRSVKADVDCQNWMKKCQSVFYSNFKGNTSTNHGILHEDKAILLYEQNLDVKVEKTGFLVNPTCPWLGFSADGVQWDSKLLIEIKCPERGKTVSASQLIEKLSFINNVNGKHVLNKNHKYYAQVQSGMMLLGLPRCHFVVYCSFDESMVIFEVEYSPTFTCNMFNVLKKIYFYYVLPCLEFYDENES
uniref:YqaJ viral recombinase domain-containing protein n=1 Tax=Trichogramma kaykai TaxID=54128 RepID=A0ABD2VUL1_9HYME